MKKILYIITIVSFGMLIYSCDDEYLERTPKDQISDPDFWQSESDLELFLNGLYDNFQGWPLSGSGFAPSPDYGTDIALSSDNMVPGVVYHLDGTTTVPASGGGWVWSNVRDINYFLANTDRIEDGGPMVDHYIGEGHYFRAYFYFGLFKRFGELPILTKSLNTEDEELFSARKSRTEVMDFILSDLDTAISKMKYGSGLTHHRQRLSKDIALMFKARLSLYEGTWEKYHQGTVFGGQTDGTKYLEQAVVASKKIIDDGNYSLIQGDTSRVYYELFNNVDYNGHPEVLFFKHFDNENQGIGNQIWNWPNSYGYTREALQQFLCIDGKPRGVSPLFEGDRLLEELPVNRDPRLVQSVMVPGDPRYIIGSDTIIFEKPDIINSGTGYESKKFRLIEVDPAFGVQNFNQDFILMRFAEALLIYAEARAELGQLTQADVDMTINRLRARVGMPPMILGNITPDPNWPDYGYALPDYLYEIRRERLVELFAEGFRLDDLFRWRAHNLFAGKKFTGVYYTEEYQQDEPGLDYTDEGFIDPYAGILSGPNGGYGFNPERDYLYPLPTNELTLNPDLTQNPGW